MIVILFHKKIIKTALEFYNGIAIWERIYIHQANKSNNYKRFVYYKNFILLHFLAFIL